MLRGSHLFFSHWKCLTIQQQLHEQWPPWGYFSFSFCVYIIIVAYREFIHENATCLVLSALLVLIHLIFAANLWGGYTNVTTFTDCGTMRSPHFPRGHQISKWQNCDLIIQSLASESKQLITCSTNPNIADTVTIATVHGVLFMPGARGLKTCILIPAKKPIEETLLRLVLFPNFQTKIWWLRDLYLFDVGHITSKKQSQTL